MEWPPKCEDCAFYETFWKSDDEELGLCRRHTVGPLDQKHTGEEYKAWWPETHSTDWCGEYWPRERIAERYKTPTTFRDTWMLKDKNRD
jgi:hypothetical protein